MIAPVNFSDEVDCGSFFDHIDDLLDFPANDIEACLSGGGSGNVDSFPSLWSAHPDPVPGSESVFSHNRSASEIFDELFVPYEGIVDLEWLSNFVEDSSSGESLTMNKEEPTPLNNHSSNSFQASSPVSVLESRKPTTPSGKRGRPRTKRPRPASFAPRLAMQLISPAPSISNTQPSVAPKASSSDSENCAESRLLIKLPKKPKKNKIKFTLPLGPNSNSEQVQNVRKCLHCEITKTPQWRAGPMGPKTLCNACGVRYMSGRLFPEYRPAASPTFVPSLHSNSHKKVVEMRNKVHE